MENYTFGVGVEPHKRWPVAWYNPAVLWQTAREMWSSADVIRNADPRELWTGVFEASDHARDASPGGEIWFDFVSDTGDGGNATYTVARAMLADTLTPEGSGGSGAFPRGQLLFFGGDLSYPGASPREYQYRFLEMFEGARTHSGPDGAGRSAYAIAQNHDWFDSISTFKRFFVNRNNREVFGLKTPQTRSYFATRLPHGWWVLGFDFALEGDLDRGQYEAFRRLAGDTIPGADVPDVTIQSGDQLLLLYPEPYWTRPLGDAAPAGYPKRYQRLEALLEAKGIHIRMRLAGDVHHYRRESSAPADPGNDDVLLTCGSGGAFLHPTHATGLARTKVKRLASEPDAMSSGLRTATRVGTVPAGEEAEGGYHCESVYPAPEDSRRLSTGNLWALFKFGWNSCRPGGGPLLQGIGQGNVLFVLALAGLYCLGMYFTALALHLPGAGAASPGDAAWWQPGADWGLALLRSPAALGVHALMAAIFCGLAAEEKGWFAKGLLHFAAHAVAMALICAAATAIFRACGATAGGLALAVLWSAAASVLCAGLITGSFLACMAWWGRLYNNAFSPLACEDYKGFLRFRLDGEGTLTGYFMGCDSVPKQWQRNPAGGGKAAGDVRPAWVEAPGATAAQWRLVDRFTLKRRITTNSGS